MRINKRLPLLVRACGFLATYLLQHVALNATRQIQQDNFAYQADEIKLRIEQRLATYEQVLHGVQGLFNASKNVDQDRNPAEKRLSSLSRVSIWKAVTD